MFTRLTALTIATTMLASSVSADNLQTLMDTNKCIRCNFGLADLSGINLTGADLRSTNLAGADLTDANLTQTNLTGANLGGADLTDANLGKANMNGAILCNTIMPDESVLFSGC